MKTITIKEMTRIIFGALSRFISIGFLCHSIIIFFDTDIIGRLDPATGAVALAGFIILASLIGSILSGIFSFIIYPHLIFPKILTLHKKIPV